MFYLSLLKTSTKASIGRRGAFLLEVTLMIFNNLIFFSMWWIFFRQFSNIGGWHFQDMVVMMATATGAYGVMQICCGGVKFLSRMIIGGDLDLLMTKPRNVLFHLLGARSLSKGWGHLATCGLLIGFGGLTQPLTLLLLMVCIMCACTIFTSVGIIAHSLAFFLGPIESLSKKYTDVVYLLTVYPTNIYSGALKIIMFTVIPAGLIGYFPVEILREFSWMLLATLISSAALFFAVAYCIFYQGLKKYESGSRFGFGS